MILFRLNGEFLFSTEMELKDVWERLKDWRSDTIGDELWEIDEHWREDYNSVAKFLEWYHHYYEGHLQRYALPELEFIPIDDEITQSSTSKVKIDE